VATPIVVLAPALNRVAKVTGRVPMPSVVKVAIVLAKALIVRAKAVTVRGRKLVAVKVVIDPLPCLIAPVRKANVAKGAIGPKKANVSKQIPI
jgi:hypothetical protein